MSEPLTPEPDLMDDTSFCNEDIAFFKAATSDPDDCPLTGGKSSIAVDSTSSIGICMSTSIPSISPLRSMMIEPVLIGITGEK